MSRQELLYGLTRDGYLLFLSRFTRLFAYGALSVILVLYLASLGLTDTQTGSVLTLALFGDAAVSLALTTHADRFGRRRILLCGAFLMSGAGVIFALTSNLFFLTLAATIGVISPSGNEVGPFLSIEQAALSQVVSDRNRTHTFAWYTLGGSIATAAGSLCGGLIASVDYRPVVFLYAALGIALAAIFASLTPAVEPNQRQFTPGEGRHQALLGVSQSSSIVLKLSALFALDAFGGGFVVQSFVAYWFHLRFGVEPAALGTIFFGANLLAGISALLAARIARRIGLVRTMVFTHLPSNILLIVVPFMPNLWLASLVLLLRFSISQMDVPTRQSYTMAVVRPEERSAAAGITGVARTVGAAIPPFFVGVMFATPALINLPFFLAGGLKILYDLLLYKGFRSHHPVEEA